MAIVTENNERKLAETGFYVGTDADGKDFYFEATDPWQGEGFKAAGMKYAGKQKPTAQARAEKAQEGEIVKKPLSKMNKTELLAVAAEKGIEVNPELTNAEIIQAIGE